MNKLNLLFVLAIISFWLSAMALTSDPMSRSADLQKAMATPFPEHSLLHAGLPPTLIPFSPTSLPDLELSVSASNTDPAQWSNFSVTFTLANTGSTGIGDVKVHVPTPPDLVLNGGNEYSSSQGTFETYLVHEWNVGPMMANSTATLTLNYFNKSSTSKGVYGQVTAANAADTDSAPGNGTPPIPNEDDEAVVYINGGATPDVCNLTATVSNVSCVNGFANFDLIVNGTTESGNDTWIGFFPKNAQGQNVPVSGKIGTAVSVAGIYFASSTLNLSVMDSDDFDCKTSFSFSCPTTNLPDLKLGDFLSQMTAAPGALVPFTFDLKNIGTATALGDYSITTYLSTDFTISADDIVVGVVRTGNTPIGTISQVQGALGIPPGQAEGNYILILKADSGDEVAELDEDNNTIKRPFEVFTSYPDGVDLKLTITAFPTDPGQWANAGILLTIENTGILTANGVVVDFANMTDTSLFNKLGYVSHTVSSGTSFDSWNGHWYIGSIPHGEKRVLDYQGFTKTARRIPMFAQVAAASPQDADSTPGNNSSGIPAEDDEALVTINVNSSNSLIPTTSRSNRLATRLAQQSFHLYPNPAKQEVYLMLDKWRGKEAQVFVYNQFGILIAQQDVDILERNTSVMLDVSAYKNGQYFVEVRSEGMPRAVRKLMVMRLY